MKVIASRCFQNLAKRWNLISNDLLVAQDLWGEKEARRSVKIMYAKHGWQHLHLPATGAKVSTRSQATVKLSAMELV